MFTGKTSSQVGTRTPLRSASPPRNASPPPGGPVASVARSMTCPDRCPAPEGPAQGAVRRKTDIQRRYTAAGFPRGVAHRPPPHHRLSIARPEVSRCSTACQHHWGIEAGRTDSAAVIARAAGRELLDLHADPTTTQRVQRLVTPKRPRSGRGGRGHDPRSGDHDGAHPRLGVVRRGAVRPRSAGSTMAEAVFGPLERPPGPSTSWCSRAHLRAGADAPRIRRRASSTWRPTRPERSPPTAGDLDFFGALLPLVASKPLACLALTWISTSISPRVVLRSPTLSSTLCLASSATCSVSLKPHRSAGDSVRPSLDAPGSHADVDQRRAGLPAPGLCAR